jgi:hypothetical protein
MTHAEGCQRRWWLRRQFFPCNSQIGQRATWHFSTKIFLNLWSRWSENFMSSPSCFDLQRLIDVGSRLRSRFVDPGYLNDPLRACSSVNLSCSTQYVQQFAQRRLSLFITYHIPWTVCRDVFTSKSPINGISRVIKFCVVWIIIDYIYDRCLRPSNAFTIRAPRYRSVCIVG